MISVTGTSRFATTYAAALGIVFHFFPVTVTASTDTPAGIQSFLTGSDWRPVDMSDVRIAPGSALDLSPYLEKEPAGKQGRVIGRKNGDLAFADKPEIPIRFNGFNMVTGAIIQHLQRPDPEQTKANIREFATLVRRQGYNIVRFLCLDTYLTSGIKEAGTVNPAKLDIIDYFFATLREQGVYIYADVAGYGLYYPGSWEEKVTRRNMKVEMLMAVPETRENWKTGVSLILNHVNPYTQTAWKNETALVCINLYNEQDLGLNTRLPHARELLTVKWHEWLKKRFATPHDLATAWHNPDMEHIKSLDDAPLPSSPYENDSAGVEYGHFLLSSMQEMHDWYRNILEGIGYKGLYSWDDANLTYRDCAIRSLSPAVSMHQYFSHPKEGPEVSPGSHISQKSSIEDEAGYLAALAWSRLWDKPFLVTEHGHCFWNQYEREAGLLFGAYSALQNYECVMIHENPVWLDVSTPMTAFSVGKSPLGRANEFIAFHLFQRGDVTPSPHRVELKVTSEFLSKNYNRTGDLGLSRIALLTGYGSRYATDGAVLSPKEPDMVLNPEGNGSASGDEWAVKAGGTVESQAALTENIAGKLRKRGILPEGNATDAARGIYQSDTGEIRLEAREKRLTVITPRTEGVALNAGDSARLSTLYIRFTTVPATVTLLSVDRQPLDKSRRMVLVYETEQANSDMELSEDRTQLIKLGSFPPLLRTGRLSLVLNLSNAQTFKVWALAINGTRKEEIPVRSTPDNQLEIVLDTANLKNGATPYFEVVAE
jgi:hypothetical protein